MGGTGQSDEVSGHVVIRGLGFRDWGQVTQERSHLPPPSATTITAFFLTFKTRYKSFWSHFLRADVSHPAKGAASQLCLLNSYWMCFHVTGKELTWANSYPADVTTLVQGWESYSNMWETLTVLLQWVQKNLCSCCVLLQTKQ